MLAKYFILKAEFLALAFLLAAVIIAAGWELSQIEAGAKADILKGLETELETSQANIRLLYDSHKRAARVLTTNEQLREIAGELIRAPNSKAALIANPVQAQLRAWIKPVLDTFGYQGFFLIDNSNINLASTRDDNIGATSLLAESGNFLDRVRSGETLMSLPLHSDVPLVDNMGETIPGLATMFTASPIKDASGGTIAILAIRIDPDLSLSQSFHVGRFGDSGETYAFNGNGLLISESRFNEQLSGIGLLPDSKHSSLHIYIRNPGYDMTVGGEARLPRDQQPLTLMAQNATAGKNGSNLDGYRDYRGVEVVGAWLWDHELGFGITTEIDADEAYATLNNTLYTVVAFAILAGGVLIILAAVSAYNRKRIIKSDARSKLILSSAGEGIYGLDINGRTTFVNPAGCKMLGYEEKELIGQPMHALVHHSYPDGSVYPREKCHMYHAFTDGTVHHVDDEVLWRKDGTSIPVEYTSTPIRDGDTLTGAVVTFKDVTERRETLRDRDRLLSAIEDSSEGVILFDADDRFIYANQKYKEIYPSEIPDLVPGKTFRDITTRCVYEGTIIDAVGREEEWIDERVLRHQRLNHIDEQQTSDGRWVRVNEFRTADGGIFGARTDITDLKDSRLKAEAASNVKSDFLSSMSHELRTPLNAILGFSQILEHRPKEPLTEAQQDSVNHIKKGGEHLLTLINDILDLAKIEAGKVDLSMEHLLPKSIFKECMGLVRGMADERGITLSGKKETDNGVLADYTRLKQVLLNLLSNAIKYNKDGGSVTFGCIDKDKDTVRIYVSDTGNGISKEDMIELFKPFSRLGMETSEIEGTGIGLTISEQLVERMGGVIGCESEVGKGSTFWIDFPRMEGPPEIALSASETEERGEAAPVQKTASGTILYIEDNPANLSLMEQIIGNIDGLSMISAHNAELGIEMAKANKPDMIILDINLPGMNGIEALKKLRNLRETATTPTIAISAAATEKDIQKGLDAGFQHYLTKPIEVQKVMNLIIEFMENAQSTD